jgi:trans-aconitate methyltransferase
MTGPGSKIRQNWNPESYRAGAAFVADYGRALLEILDPQPGEDILDLGCGDGRLTDEIAACGASVLGLDSSAEQIQAARDLGLEARLGNGENLDFESRFDGVFSNAALHWMKDADAVLAGVYQALRPGGRFVAEFGAAGNVTLIQNALHEGLKRRGLDAAAANPWYFPAKADYEAQLCRAGFQVPLIEDFDRPTPLPGALAEWLGIFAGSYLGLLEAEEKSIYLAEVCDRLAPELQQADGTWMADYLRLRFLAVKAA